MSLGAKSAADIQAIIDAALSKKPIIPKGLEEKIVAKASASKTKKDKSKAEAGKSTSSSTEKKKMSIEKTLGKAKTLKTVDKKTAAKKQKAEKAAKEKLLAKKAAKKGATAIQKKKRLDALQKLRLKEARRERKAAKLAAAVEEDMKKKTKGLMGSTTEEFDSDEDASLFDSEDDEINDAAGSANGPSTSINYNSILSKTLSGGAAKDALAEDPLAATFGVGSAFFGVGYLRGDDLYSSGAKTPDVQTKGDDSSKTILRSLAAEKASDYIPQDALLGEAHRFFSSLGESERKRNALARRKIAEMKAINKRGGDKEGFKYVLPTSVKSYARQLGGEADAPEDLASHFLGDGVQDTATAPSRKKEKKKYHDDFYSFQVAKKWTRNAEKFLSKASRTKNLFINRQQKLRTTKKL